MMIQLTRTLLALLLIVAGVAFAQGETGAYGIRTGESQAMGAGAATGQLLVDVHTTAVVTQLVDVIVVGPDGIRFRNRITDGVVQPYENLPPGAYAVMGTAEDLEIVAGITEVGADVRTTVTMVLERYAHDGGTFEDGVAGLHDPYGVAYHPVVGYDPYRYGRTGFADWGRLQVLIGIEGDADDVSDVKLTVVGPDGVVVSTFGETFIGETPPGVYSVAATMEGYQMVQALVWVRPGETASVSLPLVTLATTE